MCKHSVKKLPFQYKNQHMCDKSILENDGTLKLTSTKIKKCAVYNHLHVLEFVPE